MSFTAIVNTIGYADLGKAEVFSPRPNVALQAVDLKKARAAFQTPTVRSLVTSLKLKIR